MTNYYNKNAKDFFNETLKADMSEQYKDFLALLPVGSKILDAGCGSGRDSLIFMNRGYEVVALDGAIEMCQLAGAYIGQEVVHMQFSEIDFAPIFDGIWASASLGFKILKIWLTNDTRQNHMDERWINILVQNEC